MLSALVLSAALTACPCEHKPVRNVTKASVKVAGKVVRVAVAPLRVLRRCR